MADGGLMRVIRQSLAAAAAVALLASTAHAGCNDRLKKQFDTLYRQYAQAVRDRDPVRYMSFFADDFSMRSPDGRLHDRAEMTHYQEVNARTTKKVTSYMAEVECVHEVSPREVSVIVLQKYDRDQAPLEHPDQPHRIRTSVVQRETWRKTAAGWRIRTTVELLVGPVYIDTEMQTQQ
jgi:hypothetical protein